MINLGVGTYFALEIIVASKKQSSRHRKRDRGNAAKNLVALDETRSISKRARYSMIETCAIKSLDAEKATLIDSGIPLSFVSSITLRNRRIRGEFRDLDGKKAEASH